MKDKNPNLEVIEWAKTESQKGKGLNTMMFSIMIFVISNELGFYNLRTDLYKLRSLVPDDALSFREENYHHESPASTVLPKNSQI